MNKKVLILIAALAITVISLGGLALASDTDSDIIGSVVPRNGFGARSTNHCGGDDMLEIMKENGFEDMALAMEQGDFEAMNEYMNNLTEEEYQQMLDLMDDNGFGNMTRMMESIGFEGMVNMHNSMMGGRNKSGFMGNMMGRFNN
ncbi:hypothetical protein HYG86_15470 [Alkalicella caledoniensis]|uniref:Uncharacterized protein n=1 Tax=Alkalicella caledoniensis TaxID=2731377 RepID=A0A7G9WBK5_ALKCA|nr:hypothetical protein [Alkalicella caledoniensis]QNO16067.1 hypothetical protein HYG86_15470 [Alkalicella caledoniensis]